MFDASGSLDTGQLEWLVGALARTEPPVDDAERIDRIRLLERLKAAAAATQAEITTEFVAGQRAAQAAAGVLAKELGRG